MSKNTDANRAIIVKMIRKGASRGEAAKAADVTVKTVREWEGYSPTFRRQMREAKAEYKTEESGGVDPGLARLLRAIREGMSITGARNVTGYQEKEYFRRWREDPEFKDAILAAKGEAEQYSVRMLRKASKIDPSIHKFFLQNLEAGSWNEVTRAALRQQAEAFFAQVDQCSEATRLEIYQRFSDGRRPETDGPPQILQAAKANVLGPEVSGADEIHRGPVETESAAGDTPDGEVVRPSAVPVSGGGGD